MRIQTTMMLVALAAGTSLASAQEVPAGCADRSDRYSTCDTVGPQESRHHRGAVRVWDPNLAQWRIEDPRRVWDPNLARYRDESRHQVWDPYLARYRPRDERRDPAPAFERHGDGRHRHPGHQGWCFARH